MTGINKKEGLLTHFRFGRGFYIIATFFWIANIYGTSDYTGWQELSSIPFISKILINGIPNSSGYRGVDWAVILLSFFLIKSYRKRYYFSNQFTNFFLILIIVIIWILINPFNKGNFLELFFSRQSRFVILFPLFFYSLMFLDSKIYSIVLGRLLLIGFFVILFKSFISFIYFLVGNGMTFVGLKATILHSDVLYFLSIYQIILLWLFMIKRDNKYILFSFFLFIVIMLSQRRTEMWHTVLCSLVIISYFAVKVNSIISSLRILIIPTILINCAV